MINQSLWKRFVSSPVAVLWTATGFFDSARLAIPHWVRNVLSVAALAPLGLTACDMHQASNAAEPDQPQIDIAQGRLAGTQEDGLEVFRGIPYAAPPVAERRWQPPAAPLTWNGVREATAFGPSCTQPDIPASSVYYDPPVRSSEDCLTLNLWRQPEAQDAPVIVWIHGGSLRMGGSGQSTYDGSEFAQRGAVFVSINYRLGVLGWMAHPDLSAESPEDISGNYGLLDQIAALRWVRDNIASFGGDAGNVTIMGESAGALSVSYLLSSPDADGLFHKAIIQSANSRPFPALKQSVYGLPSAEETGTRLLNALKIDSLEAARQADAQTLTQRASQLRFAPQGTIDGQVLPDQVIDVFDQGLQNKVPVLAGFNSGEVRSQRVFLPPAPATKEAYETAIRQRYPNLADEFLKLYPGDDIEGSMLATLRDAIYGWATERLAWKMSEAGQPAYFYVFDHCYPAAATADLCAFHASELPFVFGVLEADRLPANWPVPDGETDKALSDTLLDYWTSFAATGQPSSDTGPDWPAYGAQQYYLHIGAEPEIRTDPFPGMLELHETLVQERKSAGEAWMFNVGIAARPR